MEILLIELIDTDELPVLRVDVAVSADEVVQIDYTLREIKDLWFDANVGNRYPLESEYWEGYIIDVTTEKHILSISKKRYHTSAWSGRTDIISNGGIEWESAYDWYHRHSEKIDKLIESSYKLKIEEMKKVYDDIAQSEGKARLRQMIDDFCIKQLGNTDNALKIANKMFAAARDIFYNVS